MKSCAFMLLVLCGIMMSGALASKKVVCYFTNWSFYRNGIGKFAPSDIDANLCTHVLYAFSVVENNKIKIFDKWLDEQKDHLGQVAAMREKNPNLKVLLAVGGWNAGSPPFSNMAATAATRNIFVQSVMDVLEKHNYDGLDLDWEYPAKRGGKPADKENFNLLIQDLQAAFRNKAARTGRPKMELTAAVGPAPATASVAYDINTVCRELDFVNLMTYDIHGSWESVTGYNAPLYAGPNEAHPQNVVDRMTRDWLQAGCAPHKLILGVPAYGRGWTLRGSDTSIGAAGTPGKPGPYVGQSGMLSYAEICNKLSSGWTEGYDSTVEQAYASGGGQWVGYDNERSIAAKMQYANSLGLGGAMVWALDFDDFNGQACGAGKYPLLKTINRYMSGSGGSTVPRRTTPRRPRPSSRPSPRPSPRTSPRTRTTQAPTKRSTPQRRTTPGRGSCEPACSAGTYDYLADGCKSELFYYCLNGQLYRFQCAAGTVFNTSCQCCSNS